MNRSAARDASRASRAHADRREDEQDDQHDELEPEAAEARAALRVERRALVLDRPADRRTRVAPGMGAVSGRRRSGVSRHGGVRELGRETRTGIALPRAATRARPRYHRRVPDEPRRPTPDDPAASRGPAVPLAPGARAHRHPRRGHVPRRARAAGEAAWRRVARLPLRRGASGAMGEPTGYADAAPRRSSARARRRPRARRRARTRARSRRSSTSSPARLAPHTLNAYHPRSLSYFTPPPLSCRSSARSSPSGPTRASTSGTPGPSARSSRRRSSAGCATSSGYGRGQLRAPRRPAA